LPAQRPRISGDIYAYMACYYQSGFAATLLNAQRRDGCRRSTSRAPTGGTTFYLRPARGYARSVRRYLLPTTTAAGTLRHHLPHHRLPRVRFACMCCGGFTSPVAVFYRTVTRPIPLYVVGVFGRGVWRLAALGVPHFFCMVDLKNASLLYWRCISPDVRVRSPAWRTTTRSPAAPAAGKHRTVVDHIPPNSAVSSLAPRGLPARRETHYRTGIFFNSRGVTAPLPLLRPHARPSTRQLPDGLRTSPLPAWLFSCWPAHRAFWCLPHTPRCPQRALLAHPRARPPHTTPHRPPPPRRAYTTPARWDYVGVPA